MKCNPLLVICCLATMIISYSCNKAAPGDTPVLPKPDAKEKRTINIALGGDIKTSESVLPGGRRLHNYVLARTLRDSTIYAIDVRTNGGQPYAAGLFNSPENISIELPTQNTFNIKAAAFRRGTGLGVWYTWWNGGQFFPGTFNRNLDNTISYDASDWDFLQNLSNIPLFLEDTIQPTYAFFPEVDGYANQTAVFVDSSKQVTLPLKRIAFGIRFKATNFTGGRLIVAYQNSMQTKAFTPEDIDNSLRIYTADEFLVRDDITYFERILFVLRWERPDGTVMNLGEKEIYPPRRNHMITVNVSMPTSINTVNNGLNITFTDTDWTTNETINL
ncbi:hypothetical protein [Chitinophaga sp. S165]|uniref:hypothetical protein n=1 Tax=Chitinophaga sp. S165 TaxID=2135462 RepID=UPI000D8A6254|nr:hypothetical protein [Chitinophaga sp. S165]PWV57003.1 hypothetical protein C7475_1011523 [Chitinophaga sp. S165]